MKWATLPQARPLQAPDSGPGPDRRFALGLVTALTPLALAIHGYHPYSEDGGIYIPGIKHLLDPRLYPHSLPFVEPHLRYSVFAPLVAGLVRLTHLSLPAVLLTLHLASLWTTLYAVWLLAARCYPGCYARAGAVTLMAAWLTVPVAGTSLILMDPYLTARSLSLPCTLLALAALLQLAPNLGAPCLGSEKRAEPPRLVRPVLCCVAALLMAAAFHPLMAAYALGDLLLLAALLSPRLRLRLRLRGTLTLCALAFIFAAIVQLAAPPESPAYLQAATTRYYWFLSQWHWYEILGLIAPLVILAAFARATGPRQALARAAFASGTTALLVAIAFAHERAATHLVARLQPLRAFQVVYVLMILMLGATVGERLLRRTAWRWTAAVTLLACPMYFAQRATYPGSAHIEWPGATPTNPWEQAFLWIRDNTPKAALFALDANYTSLPNEDAQGFRALAERSALPDFSKDGGEATLTPALAPAWLVSKTAQTHLSEATDAQRLAALRPLRADWIVLLQQAQTSFDCPYRNLAVKVCRLPESTLY